MLSLIRKPRSLLALSALGASAAVVTSAAMSSKATAGPSPARVSIPYRPPNDNKWPYSREDMKRTDETDDSSFYADPRFVTHIDDHAISMLSQYYSSTLPRTGRILDFCSSWVSHYPSHVEDSVRAGDLKIIGMGMNQRELNANQILSSRIIQDLNKEPKMEIPGLGNGTPLDAATCVVSIDYLSQPVEVLSSLRDLMCEGGSVHLIVSNRMFHTKAVARWLRSSEDERLQMVANYLWFAGWRDIEILVLSTSHPENGEQQMSSSTARIMGMLGIGGQDPLWVVRGVKARAS